jgi:hypothetical protein
MECKNDGVGPRRIIALQAMADGMDHFRIDVAKKPQTGMAKSPQLGRRKGGLHQKWKSGV